MIVWNHHAGTIEIQSRGRVIAWLAGFAMLAIFIFHAAPLRSQEPKAQAKVEAKQAAVEPESRLMWLIKTSGWIGLIILASSIYFVATCVRLFAELRTQVAIPESVRVQADELLKNRDFAGAYNFLKTQSAPYARVLTAGMAELPNGLAAAREAMENHSQVIEHDYEKKNSMLAVLGTLGPMIGLLGTLSGMIDSFSVIARSDVQIKASEVAGGISQALVLTFEGVLLSIPAIYFFAVFRNKITGLMLDVMTKADHYLRQFNTAYHGRKKSSESPAASGSIASKEASPREEV